MNPTNSRKKKPLAPAEKYQIWMSLIRQENTIIEAANKAGVDRATVTRIRDVAKAGALDALAQSKSGRAKKTVRDIEMEQLTTETDRLRKALGAWV